jgi:hypothetical protein
MWVEKDEAETLAGWAIAKARGRLKKKKRVKVVRKVRRRVADGGQ